MCIARGRGLFSVRRLDKPHFAPRCEPPAFVTNPFGADPNLKPAPGNLPGSRGAARHVYAELGGFCQTTWQTPTGAKVRSAGAVPRKQAYATNTIRTDPTKILPPGICFWSLGAAQSSAPRASSYSCQINGQTPPGA